MKVSPRSHFKDYQAKFYLRPLFLWHQKFFVSQLLWRILACWIGPKRPSPKQGRQEIPIDIVFVRQIPHPCGGWSWSRDYIPVYCVYWKLESRSPELAWLHCWNLISMALDQSLWKELARFIHLLSRKFNSIPRLVSTVSTVFFFFGLPKEDMFLNHLLWSIFHFNRYMLQIHISCGPLRAAFMYCIDSLSFDLLWALLLL